MWDCLMVGVGIAWMAMMFLFSVAFLIDGIGFNDRDDKKVLWGLVGFGMILFGFALSR